jgi:hypothetical protein
MHEKQPITVAIEFNGLQRRIAKSRLCRRTLSNVFRIDENRIALLQSEFGIFELDDDPEKMRTEGVVYSLVLKQSEQFELKKGRTNVVQRSISVSKSRFRKSRFYT